MPKDPSPRLLLLRAEIIARLQGLCAHWPPELFDEMVRGLAAITMKYEPISEYDTSRTEQLVAEMKELADRTALIRDQSEQKSDSA